MKSLWRTTAPVLLLLPLTACNNNSSSSSGSGGAATFGSPKVGIESVSEGGCLNIEKLSQKLNQPNFGHPAVMVTTGFSAPERMSELNKQFYAATALDKVQKPINQLGLFVGATQTACKSVQLLTPSRETIKYDVVESSDRRLRLARVSSEDEALPPYRRAAYDERTQAQGYTVEWLDEQSLRLTTNYKTVDVLCDSKATPAFTVTKMIYWAPNAGQLPSSFEVDPGFLKLAREGKGLDPSSSPSPEAPTPASSPEAPAPAPAPEPAPAPSPEPAPAPGPAPEAPTPEGGVDPVPGDSIAVPVGELRAAEEVRGNITTQELGDLVDHKVRDEVLHCHP